jgi:hypothetical protein
VGSKPPNDFNGFNQRAENSINLRACDPMTDLIARLTVPNRPKRFWNISRDGDL